MYSMSNKQYISQISNWLGGMCRRIPFQHKYTYENMPIPFQLFDFFLYFLKQICVAII